MKHTFFKLAAVVAFAVAPATFGRAVNSFAGEKLVYSLKWGIIKAGEAVIETEEVTFEGEPAARVRLTIRTSGVVDKVYKVRTVVESIMDADLERSLLYRKRQREGDRKKNITVTFDWENQEATYKNFDHERPPVEINGGTFDPLGVLFAFRAGDVKEGETATLYVCDGKKLVAGRGEVEKAKRVKTGAGYAKKTLLVKPQLDDIGGVFEKSDDATLKLWFSDSSRRIPMKVASKVMVGHFVAELEEYHAPDAARKEVSHSSSGQKHGSNRS